MSPARARECPNDGMTSGPCRGRETIRQTVEFAHAAIGQSL
jgi:hypothetical protein